jgi:hypothetical protein
VGGKLGNDGFFPVVQPLTTLAGGLFCLTESAMVSEHSMRCIRASARILRSLQAANNVDNDMKRYATAGCIAGLTYGAHKSSATSALLGCATGAFVGANVVL